MDNRVLARTGGATSDETLGTNQGPGKGGGSHHQRRGTELQQVENVNRGRADFRTGWSRPGCKTSSWQKDTGAGGTTFVSTRANL